MKFWNIFSNAHQALGSDNKPNRTFFVRTKRASFVNEDKKQVAGVEIQLEDTGCGIPADVLPKVMDPFFSTKGVTGGQNIGLGLSIVHQTVKRFGGDIVVESELGKGTVFKLYFPSC